MVAAKVLRQLRERFRHEMPEDARLLFKGDDVYLETARDPQPEGDLSNIAEEKRRLFLCLTSDQQPLAAVLASDLAADLRGRLRTLAKVRDVLTSDEAEAAG